MRAFSLQTVLWLRLIYIVSAIPATLVLAFLPLPRKLLAASTRQFDIFYFVFFIFSRVLVFFLIFSVLHISPRGDLVTYYYPEANQTLHGALAYRDFASSYAPLFSYINAAVLWLDNSPLALIAFTILVEICSVPTWFAAIRPACSEPAFRRGALLYLVQPLMLFNVAVDGGNNVWIAFSIALALFCFSRQRDAASGASYSISLTSVKFLPIVFAPLLLLSAKRRLAWVAGCLLPVLTVYGLFALKHAAVFQPVQQEGNSQLGGSLPLLFSYTTGIYIPGRISDDLTVLALLAFTFVWWRFTYKLPSDRVRGAVDNCAKARIWPISLGLLVLTLAMLMLSKKSWSIYIIMVMFLLCQFVARHGSFTRFLYCVFSFLLIVEPSFLFARVGDRHQTIHALLAHGDASAWLLIAMYIVELVCSAWFIHISIQDLRRLHTLSQTQS